MSELAHHTEHENVWLEQANLVGATSWRRVEPCLLRIVHPYQYSAPPWTGSSGIRRKTRGLPFDAIVAAVAIARAPSEFRPPAGLVFPVSDRWVGLATVATVVSSSGKDWSPSLPWVDTRQVAGARTVGPGKWWTASNFGRS